MDPSLRPRLRRELLLAIGNSISDWRTTLSLLKEVGEPLEADRSDVVGALDYLWREDKIRHPWGWTGKECEYWRSTSFKLTKGEKCRRWRAIFGMYPITDGSYNGGDF